MSWLPGLEWVSGIVCHSLRKRSELLCLSAERFELLARLRGRQLEKFRRRFDAR
jgi:hypothetical protein